MDIYRVTFIGHRRIYDISEIEEKLAPILTELLSTKEYVEFYIGRNGDFDEIAASVIKRIQKQTDRNNSSLILVLPYVVKDIEYYSEYYDEVIIPYIIEKAHPKSAITLRNRWLIDLSDMLISYTERNTGGAYATEKYAVSLNKKVINLKKIKS